MMIEMNTILLMAPPAGASGSGGGSFQFIMLGAIVLVFYFFMIRPQSKKVKEQKKFIDNLQKGDKIVTNAGIHGTIYKLNDDNTTMQLEIRPGSDIKIEKSAISPEWTMALNKPVVITDKK